jgi:hypothetical protein
VNKIYIHSGLMKVFMDDFQGERGFPGQKGGTGEIGDAGAVVCNLF